MAYLCSTKNMVFETEAQSAIEKDFEKETDDYLECMHYSSLMIKTADLLIKLTENKSIPQSVMPAMVSGLNDLKETEKSIRTSKNLYYNFFVMGASSHEIYNALAFHQNQLNIRIEKLENILQTDKTKA